METENQTVTTWEGLRKKLAPYIPVRRGFIPKKSPRYIFRGEKKRIEDFVKTANGEDTDTGWLQTSLELGGWTNCLVSEYMKKTGGVLKFISNHMNVEIPSFDVHAAFFEQKNPSQRQKSKWNLRIPNIECLAWLRQHGFPSPLLDWTESPYVAAYYALERKSQKHQARIYVRATNREGIYKTIGPFIAANSKRHVIQQCWYTYCMRKETTAELKARLGQLTNGNLKNTEFIFCKTDPDADENRLIRIILNFNEDERLKALAELQAMNITQYSLFGTLDALVETAWRKVAGD
jgi:hypothetical protein